MTYRQAELLLFKMDKMNWLEILISFLFTIGGVSLGAILANKSSIKQIDKSFENERKLNHEFYYRQEKIKELESARDIIIDSLDLISKINLLYKAEKETINIAIKIALLLDNIGKLNSLFFAMTTSGYKEEKLYHELNIERLKKDLTKNINSLNKNNKDSNQSELLKIIDNDMFEYQISLSMVRKFQIDIITQNEKTIQKYIDDKNQIMENLSKK